MFFVLITKIWREAHFRVLCYFCVYNNCCLSYGISVTLIREEVCRSGINYWLKCEKHYINLMVLGLINYLLVCLFVLFLCCLFAFVVAFFLLFFFFRFFLDFFKCLFILKDFLLSKRYKMCSTGSSSTTFFFWVFCCCCCWCFYVFIFVLNSRSKCNKFLFSFLL